MVDLGTYKDRFGDSGQRVFEHAMQESKRRDQNYIAVEHILDAFIHEEADLFNTTMRDLAIDPAKVKMQIEQRLDNQRFQNVNKGIRIAPETIDLFKRAMERARAQGRKTIEATDLFMALAQEGGVLPGLLRQLGVNVDALAENVRQRVRTREQDDEEYRKKF
jgi:ATP-dependent Clp protease ATP-binding subunit ClpA